MNLPDAFTAYTRRLMGESLFARYLHALEEEAPVSIRLNPLKCGDDAARWPLPADARPVAWCREGFYLASRPDFTFDPLLHAGRYYVQEASSMFVSHVLRQLVHAPVLMLDLCAAPGGKSTAARTALPEGSVLVVNEPVKQRASILTENVKKFGHPDMIVTNSYPRDYKQSGLRFDVILTDVPCSGEGMFRKDEGAVREWSEQNVASCRQLQRSIVEDIWPCLREGGLLIYSTCTYNAHEDEENVAWIAETLGADLIEVPVEEGWVITGALQGELPIYRFIPGQTQGEGLFMAVLRKHGEDSGVMAMDKSVEKKELRRRGRDRDQRGKSGAEPLTMATWLEGEFKMIEERDQILAVPSRWADLYWRCAASLHVLHAGVTVGTRKGRDVIPDASLALSTALSASAFPRVNLDYASAVNYLRKEVISLPEGTPRGFVLMTYEGAPLGFVKNVGSRANNHYPQEWKIRSTHLPENPVRVLSGKKQRE